jgi:hypothetical protein
VVVAESGIAGLKTMKALYQKKKKGQQTQQQQPLTQPSPPPMPQPNALDMLDNSPPKQASSIDVTKLEDSMNIRKNKGSLKKKQHAATFSRQNTKSVHNARMGFLNKLKLKKMNTVAVVGGGGGGGSGGGGGGGGGREKNNKKMQYCCRRHLDQLNDTFPAMRGRTLIDVAVHGNDTVVVFEVSRYFEGPRRLQPRLVSRNGGPLVK